jgi:hypothetical protein
MPQLHAMLAMLATLVTAHTTPQLHAMLAMLASRSLA